MSKKNIGFSGLVLLVGLLSFSSVKANAADKIPTDDKNFPSLLTSSADAPQLKHQSDSLYDLIALNLYGLERDVFFTAYKGYQILLNKGAIKKKNILTVCDYSQSSNNKRLYIIDVKEGRLLYNTFVSHGKNSGGEYATSFSNLQSSNKSSLGFMVTAETYRGKAGYSLRFNGMEAGINSNVRNRDIVLHGSNFVNTRVMQERGTIGNSLGCPAVPLAQHKQIIDAIKGGSCFFVNHPDSWYTRTSAIINAKFDLAPEINNAVLAQQLPEKTGGSTGNGVTEIGTLK